MTPAEKIAAEIEAAIKRGDLSPADLAELHGVIDTLKPRRGPGRPPDFLERLAGYLAEADELDQLTAEIAEQQRQNGMKQRGAKTRAAEAIAARKGIKTETVIRRYQAATPVRKLRTALLGVTEAAESWIIRVIENTENNNHRD